MYAATRTNLSDATPLLYTCKHTVQFTLVEIYQLHGTDGGH